MDLSPRYLRLARQKSRGARNRRVHPHLTVVTFRIPDGLHPPNIPIPSEFLGMELPARDKSADNGHRSTINQIKRKREGGGAGEKSPVDVIDRMKMGDCQFGDHSFIERRRLFNHADIKDY